jgi:hypothetical protein
MDDHDIVNDPDLFDIEGMGEQLAMMIRNYCENQKDYWKKIPWLALQADGRKGYRNEYAIMYRYGYLRLSASFFVDLATGKLVSGRNLISPPTDSEILHLAASIQDIDAEKIVEKLEHEAKEPTAKCYNSKEQEKWRKKLARTLKVTPEYQRSCRPRPKELLQSKQVGFPVAVLEVRL